MLNILTLDAISYIFDNCESDSQFILMQTCHTFNNFHITNLDISNSLSSKITIGILKKYKYVKKLNLYDNINIFDISEFYNLTKLNISGRCIIDQNNISHLGNLIELNISNNCKIYDLSVFTNLQTLHINCRCNNKITQTEISKLPYLTKIHHKFNDNFV